MTQANVEAARGGISPTLGRREAYRPTVWLDDAGAAVAAAAVARPPGIYNVADEDPPTSAEIDAALAAVVGRDSLRPAMDEVPPAAEALARSQRVSSRRLRAATGWAPRVRGGTDGWRLITAAAARGMTVAQRFARARPRLLRLAYSQLGDLGEAEDVVQEAWLRLERTGAESIDDLDALADHRRRPARARHAALGPPRREAYVGPWLPEPVESSEDPADRVTLDESVSYALLAAARAALPRRAHGVRAARRVRAAVRRGRGGRRPHARGGAPARLARPPPRRAAAAALRGLARRARARGARVRASGRRGRPRRPGRGARSGRRVDLRRRRARDRRPQAGARRRRASRAAWVAMRRRAADAPAAIGLNGRLGLLLAGTDGHRSAVSFVVDGGRIARIDVVRNPEKLRRVTRGPARSP